MSALLETVTASRVIAEPASKTSVVVLIGEAGKSPELMLVLSELLGRQEVRPHFVLEERFEPNVLLADNPTDARVWVFVRPSDEHKAELYFRGPFGQRFLRRELALSHGLADEVGRELVAQVIDSSTAALIHSSAGMNRDEAKADLAREQAPNVPKVAPSAPLTESVVAPPGAKPPSSRLEFDATLRAGARFAGADLGHALGVGALAGTRFRSPRGFLGGAWLTFDAWAPQSIETARLTAHFSDTSLRAGLEVGRGAGHHTLALALGGGVDLVRIAPEALRDTSFVLAGESVNVVAMARAEVRYEFGVESFRLGLALFADTSLAHTHYDVTEGAENVRVATPWLLRPGLALYVGMAPTLSVR